MIDASIARYGRATALEFFGAATTYARAGRADRPRGRGPAPARRRRTATGSRSCCRTARSTSSRSTRCCGSGAIVVEHNPLYTARELRHQFEDHGARVAIVWDKVADTVAEFPSRPAGRRTSSRSTSPTAMPCGTRLALRLPVAKARAARAALTATPTARRARRLAEARRRAGGSPSGIRARRSTTSPLLQYTSGTTGTPEGRRSSPTATCARTRCRAAPGCPGCTRARRPSTACCRCSTPTA